jgi:hypothetical protein
MQRDSRLRGSEHRADADGCRALQLKHSSERGEIDPQLPFSTLHSGAAWIVGQQAIACATGTRYDIRTWNYCWRGQ